MKMKRRIIALTTALTLFVSFVPLHSLADGIEDIKAKDKTTTIGEMAGYLAGARKTINKIIEEEKFTYSQGHGFAAEAANNLSDRLKGKNATVVGGDNLKNGPDRKIINRDGTVTWIQDKYYNAANRSVNAAFDADTGLYRYIDGDGVPMQLEVPSDQYEESLKLFSKKIEEGKVPGVTDSQEASKYVRKGKYSYKQAENLTKAGNIDSIKYDATNGFIYATCALGITFALDFASCMINGENAKDALKEASINGIKTGGVVWATYVISSQISKTGLTKALVPTVENIAKTFGDDVSRAILAACGKDAATMTAKQITSEVAKILSNQIIVEAVVIVVLTVPDIIDLCKGRISSEQLLKNLTVAILSAGGAIGGGFGGAAIGTAIGNVPGGVIGGIIGSVAGGTGTGFLSDWALSKFLKDDADKMYEIIIQEFQKLADAYLLTQTEADAIIEELQNKLKGDTLKDMYESDNRSQFAINLMEPLFENQVKKRPKIVVPSEEEVRYEMLSSLNGILFVH